MRIHHDASVDYLCIDFNDEVEAKSIYQDGIIVRYDSRGSVVGIDITDSERLFGRSQSLTLNNVCNPASSPVRDP